MAKVKKAKAKPKTGRPSAYSVEIGRKICARIVEGKSLRQICEAAGMPTKTTVMRWLADDRRPDFRDQYARAREAQMESLADEIMEIADDSRNDFIDRVSKDGKTTERTFDPENVQRSRLRIEARKWLMSKLAPKKYGDKLDLEINDKRPKSPEQRRARIAELLAMGQVSGNGGSDVAPAPETKLH